MRDWRNRQTRTFKGRVGDRVSSSLTSRTKRTSTNVLVLFYYQSRISIGQRLAEYSACAPWRSQLRCSAERQTRTFKGRVGDRVSDGIVITNQFV